MNSSRVSERSSSARSGQACSSPRGTSATGASRFRSVSPRRPEATCAPRRGDTNLNDTSAFEPLLSSTFHEGWEPTAISDESSYFMDGSSPTDGAFCDSSGPPKISNIYGELLVNLGDEGSSGMDQPISAQPPASTAHTAPAEMCIPCGGTSGSSRVRDNRQAWERNATHDGRMANPSVVVTPASPARAQADVFNSTFNEGSSGISKCKSISPRSPPQSRVQTAPAAMYGPRTTSFVRERDNREAWERNATHDGRMANPSISITPPSPERVLADAPQISDNNAGFLGGSIFTGGSSGMQGSTLGQPPSSGGGFIDSSICTSPRRAYDPDQRTPTIFGRGLTETPPRAQAISASPRRAYDPDFRTPTIFGRGLTETPPRPRAITSSQRRTYNPDLRFNPSGTCKRPAPKARSTCKAPQRTQAHSRGAYSAPAATRSPRRNIPTPISPENSSFRDFADILDSSGSTVPKVSDITGGFLMDSSLSEGPHISDISGGFLVDSTFSEGPHISDISSGVLVDSTFSEGPNVSDITGGFLLDSAFDEGLPELDESSFKIACRYVPLTNSAYARAHTLKPDESLLELLESATGYCPDALPDSSNISDCLDYGSPGISKGESISAQYSYPRAAHTAPAVMCGTCGHISNISEISQRLGAFIAPAATSTPQGGSYNRGFGPISPRRRPLDASYVKPLLLPRFDPAGGRCAPRGIHAYSGPVIPPVDEPEEARRNKTCPNYANYNRGYMNPWERNATHHGFMRIPEPDNNRTSSARGESNVSHISDIAGGFQVSSTEGSQSPPPKRSFAPPGPASDPRRGVCSSGVSSTEGSSGMGGSSFAQPPSPRRAFTAPVPPCVPRRGVYSSGPHVSNISGIFPLSSNVGSSGMDDSSFAQPPPPRRSLSPSGPANASQRGASHSLRLDSTFSEGSSRRVAQSPPSRGPSMSPAAAHVSRRSDYCSGLDSTFSEKSPGMDESSYADSRPTSPQMFNERGGFNPCDSLFELLEAPNYFHRSRDPIEVDVSNNMGDSSRSTDDENYFSSREEVADFDDFTINEPSGFSFGFAPQPANMSGGFLEYQPPVDELFAGLAENNIPNFAEAPRVDFSYTQPADMSGGFLEYRPPLTEVFGREITSPVKPSPRYNLIRDPIIPGGLLRVIKQLGIDGSYIDPDATQSSCANDTFETCESSLGSAFPETYTTCDQSFRSVYPETDTTRDQSFLTCRSNSTERSQPSGLNASHDLSGYAADTSSFNQSLYNTVDSGNTTSFGSCNNQTTTSGAEFDSFAENTLSVPQSTPVRNRTRDRRYCI